jgi:hypothetical protein
MKLLVMQFSPPSRHSISPSIDVYGYNPLQGSDPVVTTLMTGIAVLGPMTGASWSSPMGHFASSFPWILN